jgi:hypothetical protein
MKKLKLVVRKETLRRLTDVALAHVVGGVTDDSKAAGTCAAAPVAPVAALDGTK